jgi:hypothetical protein
MITFKAEQSLIERARLAGKSRQTTLSAAFREWLEMYTAQARSGVAMEELMRRLRHVGSSGPYTRDEMHER